MNVGIVSLAIHISQSNKMMRSFKDQSSWWSIGWLSQVCIISQGDNYIQSQFPEYLQRRHWQDLQRRKYQQDWFSLSQYYYTVDLGQHYEWETTNKE